MKARRCIAGSTAQAGGEAGGSEALSGRARRPSECCRVRALNEALTLLTLSFPFPEWGSRRETCFHYINAPAKKLERCSINRDVKKLVFIMLLQFLTFPPLLILLLIR